MIDQISQVYYPADLVTDSAEDDRFAVRQMYQWLFGRVREMNGSFQLITTDHVDLREDCFQKAVIDRWRNGKKLLPAHWISRPEVGWIKRRVFQRAFAPLGSIQLREYFPSVL
jgi:hypothetical protein